jgi:hypothetical protein
MPSRRASATIHFSLHTESPSVESVHRRKSPLRESQQRLREVVVVGPPDVVHAVAQIVGVGRRVIGFPTFEELDCWRKNRDAEDRSIFPDLVTALAEAGCRLGALPQKLRGALEAVGGGTNVPSLRQIEGRWPSRRSFYRMWHSRIEPAPAAFLRRVRALHARRLLANGRTKKEAALLAGYSSVDHMRRNISTLI